MHVAYDETQIACSNSNLLFSSTVTLKTTYQQLVSENSPCSHVISYTIMAHRGRDFNSRFNFTRKCLLIIRTNKMQFTIFWIKTQLLWDRFLLQKTLSAKLWQAKTSIIYFAIQGLGLQLDHYLAFHFSAFIVMQNKPDSNVMNSIFLCIVYLVSLN